MSDIAGGGRSCQALVMGDIGVSWSRPGQALLSTIVSQWRWMRCPKRRYHAGLKREFRKAAGRISPGQGVDESISDIVNVILRRVRMLPSAKDSIAIVGPFRVGKTTIASAICCKGSHVHIPIDTIISLRQKWPALAESEHLAELVCRAVLEQMPKGVLIEGWLNVDDPEVQKLSTRAHLIFVGDVGSHEARAENILKYRSSHWCWTVQEHPDESEVFKIAEEIIERSRHLEKLGREIGVPFIPIRGSHAEADIQHAIDLIWSRVNCDWEAPLDRS